MYGGGFGHDDLGRVVDVSERVTIAMTVDLEVRLRSCEERGLRIVVLSSSVKVDSVPGPELSQLPSKSVLTKRTRWESSLYYALLIYKNVYLLLFVHVCDCRISIESSCH